MKRAEWAVARCDDPLARDRGRCRQGARLPIDVRFDRVRDRMLSFLGDLMAAGANVSRRWRTEPARVRAFLDSLGDGSMFCDCDGSADPLEACGSA